METSPFSKPGIIQQEASAPGQKLLAALALTNGSFCPRRRCFRIGVERSL